MPAVRISLTRDTNQCVCDITTVLGIKSRAGSNITVQHNLRITIRFLGGPQFPPDFYFHPLFFCKTKFPSLPRNSSRDLHTHTHAHTWSQQGGSSVNSQPKQTIPTNTRRLRHNGPFVAIRFPDIFTFSPTESCPFLFPPLTSDLRDIHCTQNCVNEHVCDKNDPLV